MNEVRDYAAPLGSTTGGRLEFVYGAANVAIRSDAKMEHLYRARCEGSAPEVEVDDGTVTVRYPRRFGLSDLRRQSGEVTLNGAIPWQIAVGGGLSELDADLSGIRLDSFEVEGGVSGVELTLAEPSGTVPVRIDGGASNITIRRPKGVAASVLVGGGASKLALDDQYFGAVGGETKLESSGYASATDRYEISITRGAGDVAVVTR